MKNTDVRELRGLWKKDSICCDRFAVCYVDNQNGNTLMSPSQPFLMLAEKQMNRHLALIKKMLPGDIGGKLLQVPLADGASDTLMDALESRLHDEEVMEVFFENIMNKFPGENNYVILAYHVLYDIPKRGMDGIKQDESEEVYEHLLCMICPTKMTKTALAVENGALTLTAQHRVVSDPITGIIWPAFDNRSEDRDAIIVYNKDDEKPERYLHMKAFGASDYRTTGELRRRLRKLFEEVFKKEDIAEKYQADITEKLGKMAPEAVVEKADFDWLIAEAHLPEDKGVELSARYTDRLGVYHPTAYQLMDPDYILTVTEEKKGSRMRNLLLKAAAAIEDTQGPESELVRDLLSAADLQAGR